ncbi:FecR family protein [Pseudoflavitalea rhizosphaerae]|uniref:FecR family protein n=1 Tax=Pseudoflavitalea rhizosphaerae TaxID=1884793 RepID=UPI000F8E0867|nr:FecR family protein [Pseudoflavitalea rhizosphaerae]
MAYQPSIEELLIKQLQQPLTAVEEEMLNQWLEASPQNRELYNSFQNKEQLESKLNELQQFDENAAWNKMIAAGKWEPVNKKKVHRLFSQRWQYAAAAVLFLAIGSGVYYLVAKTDSTEQPVAVVENTEILPGKNQAILTIGDSVINLSDQKTGIVTAGNAITYNDGEKIAKSNKLITLSTPRGGQFQAVLPDGSKVWLNAASSIEFPSKFSSKERAVKVSGEVYFEVAQNQQAPFMVMAGNTTVQVLGTSFNINAYNDERVVRTTLVNGSVRVLPLEANGRNVILKPGQQAVSSDNGEITGVFSPELANILAWKNGFFSFDKADIETVMRQMERWYDIKVQYRGTIPTVKLNGDLDRQIPLSDVLKYLSRLNIKFEREGRTITILP